jgi:hypothetical protein
VDADGIVQTAETGVRRAEHYIAGTRTLLLEGQRTNLCIRSEEFDTWTDGSSCAVTANDGVAPDSTATADLLTASVVGSSRRRNSTFTGDGEKCIALFVKQGTATVNRLFLEDVSVSATRHAVTITWTGGVPALTTFTGSGTRYPVEALANGWYRILFSANNVVAANTNSLFILPDVTAGTGTLLVWGAQAENAVVPSSYIKTEATTITRNADSLFFPFERRPQEMTVYVRGVERDRLASGINTRLFTISDASDAAPRFLVYRNSASAGYRTLHNPSGNSETTSQGTTAVRGNLVEIRATLSAAGAAGIGVSIDGGTESTNTASAQALAGAWSGTRLTLNATGAGANLGLFAYTHVVVAQGEQTMATMRQLAGVA